MATRDANGNIVSLPLIELITSYRKAREFTANLLGMIGATRTINEPGRDYYVYADDSSLELIWSITGYIKAANIFEQNVAVESYIGDNALRDALDYLHG